MSRRPLLLVLAHGILGWGEPAGGDNQLNEYYYGVRPFLEREYGKRDDLSLTIIAPTVQAAESVAVRGQDLTVAIREAIDKMPHQTRVHIIAHSMGGLDARWVIAEGSLTDRIDSLTTIATPHQGTTLGYLAHSLRDAIPLIAADLGNIDDLIQDIGARARDLFSRSPGGRPSLQPAHFECLRHLLNNLVDHSTPAQLERGLYALTLKGAEEFNSKLAATERAIREGAAHRVAYFSYGGVMSPESGPLLKPSSDLMSWFGTAQEQQVGNDGAVSVWSAHFPWDETGHHYMETLPYDHFSQINWRIPDTRPSEDMPADLQAVYRNMMNRILSIAPQQRST